MKAAQSPSTIAVKDILIKDQICLKIFEFIILPR